MFIIVHEIKKYLCCRLAEHCREILDKLPPSSSFPSFGKSFHWAGLPI